jgi:hypothetical protein
VVNKGHVGKCHSYYQFIMKAEGMKNCSVRIIHAQQTVSPAFHTRGFSMNNLKFDLKHLVAINSLISSMFSSLGRFVINLRCSACPPVIEPGLSCFSQFPFANPIGSELLPDAFVQKLCAEYTLVMPWWLLRAQERARGVAELRGLNLKEIGILSHLQTTIPKDVEETILSPTEETRLSRGQLKQRNSYRRGR